jgi:hypothetical protein
MAAALKGEVNTEPGLDPSTVTSNASRAQQRLETALDEGEQQSTSPGQISATSQSSPGTSVSNAPPTARESRLLADSPQRAPLPEFSGSGASVISGPPNVHFKLPEGVPAVRRRAHQVLKYSGALQSPEHSRQLHVPTVIRFKAAARRRRNSSLVAGQRL